MIGRELSWRSVVVCCLALLSAGPVRAARADVIAWYELVTPLGGGLDDMEFQQGGPGTPLLITIDGSSDPVDFTIRFVADVLPMEALVGYSVDLVAPDEAGVSVLDSPFTYLGEFDFEVPPLFGSGPGVILDDAGQFNFFGDPQEGVLTLFEFVLHLDGSSEGDVEVFSGIGADLWATFGGSPVFIVFADSDPLDGGEAGLISSTPSIIIRSSEAPEPGDCDQNGRADDAEIASDPSLDCNENGVLDVCDVDPSDPDGDGQVSDDCDGDQVPDECGVFGQVVSEGFEDIGTLGGDGWVLINHSEPLGILGWFQGSPLAFDAQAGAPDAYIAASYESAGNGTINNWLISPETSLENGTELTFYTRTVPGSSYPDRLEVRMSLAGDGADVGETAFDVGDFTTLLLSINPDLAVGGYPEVWQRYSVVLEDIEASTRGRLAFRYFVTDAGPSGVNSNYIGIDTVEIIPLATDCNANGVPDGCDITGGASLDCDDNGVPDECDLAGNAGRDCDENGVLDICEMADGGGQDCNGNGVPDRCDLRDGTSFDCDGNGVPDECDVANGTGADCNANGVPDACDIADGTNEDCNGNGVPDRCDLAADTSLDCNRNRVPDECDIAAGASADLDGDAVPDECEPAIGSRIPGGRGARPGVRREGDGRIVGRGDLRSFLALLFNVPVDGRETLAAIPARLFGVFGVQMSVTLTFLEWLNLPVRAFLFEVTYTVLDAILP